MFFETRSHVTQEGDLEVLNLLLHLPRAETADVCTNAGVCSTPDAPFPVPSHQDLLFCCVVKASKAPLEHIIT